MCLTPPLPTAPAIAARKKAEEWAAANLRPVVEEPIPIPQSGRRRLPRLALPKPE